MTGQVGPGAPAHGLAAEFLEALARVEASASFRASRQARILLRYLVERVLAGEADRLKGYTVAVEALGKPADFDAASDPAARVAMRRLRLLLEDYYTAEGQDDAARIVLEPGAYAPRLLFPEEARPPEPAPAAAPPPPPVPFPPPCEGWRFRRNWAVIGGVLVLGVVLGLPFAFRAPATRSLDFREAGTTLVRQTERLMPPKPVNPPDVPPVLVVQPLEVEETAQAPAAAAFTEALRTGLARFSELQVRDGHDGGHGAGYRLSGRMMAGGALRLELTEARTGVVLTIFDASTALGQRGEAAAHFIITSLGQPYGLILSRERARLGNQREALGFSCLLWLFDYWRGYEPSALPRIEACLRRTLEDDPGQPSYLAALGLTRLEEYRLASPPEAGGRPGGRALLDEAYALVRQAADAAPFDARVRQALGAVHYIRGDVEMALAALRRARQLNPYDPDIAADLASRLLGYGIVTEARGLLAEACRFATARPAWMNFFLFLAELLSDNKAGAVERADRLTDSGFVLNLLARLIAARLQGDEVEAARWRAALAQRDPAWLTDPASILRRRFQSAEVVETLSRYVLDDGLGEPVRLVNGQPAASPCLNEPQF